MSKKLSKKPEEFSGSPWTNLPPDLLLLISSFLVEKIDVFRFRRVCSIWRSSIPRLPNQNKISSLFPYFLPFSCLGRPDRLTANGIYLLKNDSLAFILSLQESEPGKLLLRHPLTYTPTIVSSGDSLDSLVSGWTITRLAISHSLDSIYSDKACFLPLFHSSRDEECKFYVKGDWLLYSKKNSLNGARSHIDNFVNFCGCTYAVNQWATVYLVRHYGSKRLQLTCVNPSKVRNPSKYGKRFVISDGDLYLVFNFTACVPPTPKPNSQHRCYTPVIKPNSDHRCHIYKLELDDLKHPTSYTMERVTSLGGRAFFFNWDCSFSIRTRHLPPHTRSLLANRIFVAKSAFPSCRCCKDRGFREYSARGKFRRTLRPTLALFKPPSVWIQQWSLIFYI